MLWKAATGHLSIGKCHKWNIYLVVSSQWFKEMKNAENDTGEKFAVLTVCKWQTFDNVLFKTTTTNNVWAIRAIISVSYCQRNTTETILLTWVNVNPAWMSNCIHNKAWNEIYYQLPYFSATAVKFANGLIISSHTLMGIWSPIHAGIKVNPCQEMVPRVETVFQNNRTI